MNQHAKYLSRSMVEGHLVWTQRHWRIGPIV